jgi:lipopolysaccharide export system protein LptC
LNRWYFPIAFAALAGLSFWLLREVEQVAPESQVASTVPDYYLHDMIRTVMDEEGATKYVLRASRVRHFAADDSTELESPKMEVYNGEAGAFPWQVSAERGWVGRGGDVIMLYGHVEIWRLDASGEREIEVVTTGLRVLPADRYAESETPATISTPRSVTRSIGMRANLAHNRLELPNRVRSRYERN